MTDSCLVMGGVWLGGVVTVAKSHLCAAVSSAASSVCLLSTVFQGDQYWASLPLFP